MKKLAESDYIVTHGYDKVDGSTVENIKFSSLYQDWLDEKLTIKILDSSCHVVDLPRELLQH